MKKNLIQLSNEMTSKKGLLEKDVALLYLQEFQNFRQRHDIGSLGKGSVAN